MGVGLQAYGICQDCAEIYPASGGCPVCDGDSTAAAQSNTMRIAHVVGAKNDSMDAPTVPRLGRPAKRALIAAFGISLFVGSLFIAVLQI